MPSTPDHLRNTPFHAYQLRDIATGATVMTGRVYQWDPEHTNTHDSNSYTFIPPIMIKPGLMILIKE